MTSRLKACAKMDVLPYLRYLRYLRYLPYLGLAAVAGYELYRRWVHRPATQGGGELSIRRILVQLSVGKEFTQ